MDRFQDKVLHELFNKKIHYEQFTNSKDKLDFLIVQTVEGKEHSFWLELKEKNQHYNKDDWPCPWAELDMFIVDDLTIRKILWHSPDAGLLVWDNIRDKLFFWTPIDLMFVDKIRGNRKINKEGKEDYTNLKGKAILNTSQAKEFATIQAAVYHIEAHHIVKQGIYTKKLECIPYVKTIFGVVRKPEHWEEDLRGNVE